MRIFLSISSKIGEGVRNRKFLLAWPNISYFLVLVKGHVVS